MGRTISNPVIRMYFVYDLSTNTSTCTILDCPHPLRSGRHAGNLENHIKAFHPNEYKELRVFFALNYQIILNFYLFSYLNLLTILLYYV